MNGNKRTEVLAALMSMLSPKPLSWWIHRLSGRVDRPESYAPRGVSCEGNCSAFSFMRTTRLLKTFSLGLALPVLLLSSPEARAQSSDEYDDIQIVRSDQNGVIFRYLVPPPEKTVIQLGKELFDLVNVDQCGLSNSPGGFQLPVRRVIIAVPPEGEVSVEILDQSQEELSGINLAPAVRAEPDQQNPAGYRAVPLKTGGEPVELYPPEIVVFDSPTWLRNQRIIQLEIFPVQYDPARRSVKQSTQITVGVSFSRGGQAVHSDAGKDLFETIYRNVLLNYDQSRVWRKAGDRPNLRKPSTTYPFGYSDHWYKVIVRENGIYRIDRTMLIQAGVPVSTLDPRTIRLFSGGGKVLPLENSNPLLELEEIAIYISGEEDGLFDSEDFLLFFGWSPNDWDYDSAGNDVGFHTNPFTNDNVFWLTFDPAVSFPDPPRRMSTKDGSPTEANPIIPVSFSSRIHVEQDNSLRIYSSGLVADYFNWYWMEAISARLFVSLPDLVPEEGGLIKIKHTQSYPDLWINGGQLQIIDSLSTASLSVARSFDFHGGMVDTIEMQFPGETGAYLDWYEIEYSRSFECHDRQLFFESPEVSGIAEYHISGLHSPEILLFDVNDYGDVKRIVGVQVDGETAIFQDTIGTDAKRRYFLMDESRIKEPAALIEDQISNWREASNQADFLIITHSEFYDQMAALKTFRESADQMSVRVVRLEDIYDEFSGGLSDPVAIRDFLKFAYANWERPAPAYVLLVGDGHYDYKDNLRTDAGSFIPPFAPIWEGDVSVSDDQYVYFGRYGYLDSDSSYGPLDRGLDMVIGRWPVRMSSEVEVVLDKVIGYENEPEFGTWRNLITLVADDEYSSSSSSERVHTDDTEKLAKFHVPASFNLSKVYMMEYPFDPAGEKPEAEDAIINAFNSGTLVINYMGHGNPDVWAHEHVFKRSQDIPRLNNNRKLPLVYTASCSIGLFFDPLRESMGEQFLRTEGKGSIATISATWLVFPQANAELNFKVYDLLLGPGSLSVGDALFVAKLLRQPNANDRRFVLFGDPAMKLAVPRLKAEITQVQPDTISALRLINLEGEIRDAFDSLLSDFEGTARILAFDSERELTHIMPGGGKVDYNLPGLIMFRGDAEVKEGRFQASFVVPKDISYGGNTGRISVYLEGGGLDGAGVRDSLVIRGSDTTVVDTLGPQISVICDDDEIFLNGGTVFPNSVLHLRLFDENGINITGEVGHGITLVIDQDFQKETDLTERFQYDVGSYQQGSLIYQLPDLSDGLHDLTVKAWDNANNSSVEQISLRVTGQAELELTEVMNYPNPFPDQTSFCYHLSREADRVEIKIFTEAGRLIRHIPFASARVGYNYSTTWNGEDQAGDKVASGVYIYKITAEGTMNGERKTKEVYGKAVVVR